MSNDAILPFSRRKTKSRVIGLPGKLPETFVATIVFPSRSTTANGSNVCWYLSAVSRRHATMSSSPSLVRPSSLTMPSGAKHAASTSGSRAFSKGQEAFNGFWQMYRHGCPSTSCRFASVVTASKDGHVHTEWQNAYPAAARYVRFGSEADICTAIGHVRFTPAFHVQLSAMGR
jgi:hypothetical protein